MNLGASITSVNAVASSLAVFLSTWQLNATTAPKAATLSASLAFRYARYESAEEVLDRAEVEGRRFMSALELNQLPAFGLAEPLA